MQALFREELICEPFAAESAEDTIRRMGEVLISAHCVTADYIDAALSREEDFPTGIQLHNAGIAIPHATPEENVLRSGIAVVKLLSPVDFHSMENPEDTVAANLVLFLALKDQQLHLEILKKLFLSLQKPELVQKLIDSRDGKSLLEVLQKKLEL